MRPVVEQRHVVGPQRLVRHGQVTVGARLRTAVVHLLADRQLLLVVFDGRFVKPRGGIGVADVSEGAPHSRTILKAAGDRQMGLVQFEGSVVFA